MLESLSFVTFDVFTSQRYAGNPLAIVLVPAGEDIETNRMQLIAREFNFSETVFLYEQDEQTTSWRFRIFTINQELTFAGHPTIGTAVYLTSRLKSGSKGTVKPFSLLCQAGCISCTSDRDATVQRLPGTCEEVRVDVPHNFHIHTTTVSKKQVLKLQPSLNVESMGSIQLVSPVKGMTFLVVELLNHEALDLVQVTGVAPEFARDDGWDFGFLGTAFFHLTSQGADAKVRGDSGHGRSCFKYSTRMVETSMEDPATGSMSCGLAALLALRARAMESDFVFTQGTKMGRESHIGISVTLDATGKAIKTLSMRGQAVEVARGSISV